jgi:hypothetical protein
VLIKTILNQNKNFAMPQTDEQLLQELLGNASQTTQEIHGYKPEAKTTTIASGPENNAPKITISNFDKVASDNTRKWLKKLDAGYKGVQERYNFSFETTLKNVFDGVYDNAVTSKDKEISSAWKALKDGTVKYFEDIGKAERGLLSEEQIRSLDSTPNDLLNLWNSATNSLNVYYDTKTNEVKARTGDNKKLYYSPVADRVVDELTFERNESPIHQGEFFSNVPAYVSKHNPTETEIRVSAFANMMGMNNRATGTLGMVSSGINWLWGIDKDDLKLREEKTKIAGYNDAYNMIWQTDPNVEQASKALTKTYFDRASYMTTNDNAKKHYFKGVESDYINHNQMLEENVGHLLNLMENGGSDEAANLNSSFMTALQSGNKDGFKKWMTNNRRSFLNLTKQMTPVQNVRMYYHYKDVGTKGGTAIFNNPHYFDKDLKAGQDKLTSWKNIVDPYIKEQNNLRKDLYKINKSVVNKMQTEKNPDHMQNNSSGYQGNYQEALFLKHMFNENGSRRSAEGMYSAIDAEAQRLAEKYPDFGADPGYQNRYNQIMNSPEMMKDLSMANNAAYTAMVKEQAMQIAGGSNSFLANLRKNTKGPKPTDAEKRFMDWYFRPMSGGEYGSSDSDRNFLNGAQWMRNSGEAKESYNKINREFKIKFGEESVSETFKHTMMRDSFGKAGAHSVEYHRIDRNNPNAIKTKHFNKIIDIAETSFKNDADAGKVYIKDGALNHTDRPDMYTSTNRQERSKQLKDFLKDDKAEYKLSYINQTADRNKVAYMISKYDKQGNFNDHITLFMDKAYAKANDEIFASSVFNDLSDERYRLQGSYDLSALDDKRIGTNLRLQSEDEAMWLMGDNHSIGKEGEELKIFIGSNAYTTVDDAIEKIRFNFSEYIKKLNAQQ